MFIVFFYSFMQMLFFNFYMLDVFEDCYNYFKSYEFYFVLERLFLKSYLNQRKIIGKIYLKV